LPTRRPSLLPLRFVFVSNVCGRARSGAWAIARMVLSAWALLVAQNAEYRRLLHLRSLHLTRLLREEQRLAHRIKENVFLSWCLAIANHCVDNDSERLQNELFVRMQRRHLSSRDQHFRCAALHRCMAAWKDDARTRERIKLYLAKSTLESQVEGLFQQVQQLTESLQKEIHGKSELVTELRQSQKNQEDLALKCNGSVGSVTTLYSGSASSSPQGIDVPNHNR